MKRRKSIKTMAALSVGLAGSNLFLKCKAPNELQPTQGAENNSIANPDLFFKISLAQWSLHRSFFDKKLDHLDFAAKARYFDIEAIEYVNAFFPKKAKDTNYLNQMNQRAVDQGVKQLLIMVDGEGGLAELDTKERNKAVENHYKWVDAASYLGCHSIRVNSFGKGTAKEVKQAAIEGLGKLAEFAAKQNINVIVENHGGYSSDGKWLAQVMNQINMPNCGTLPDFGNFCIAREGGKQWSGKCINEYDKYQGVQELMPFAKAVSAKSFDFDDQGNETTIDFLKMMKTVRDQGYQSYVGIEYEGENLSEGEGIIATKKLLEKVGQALTL